MDEDFNYDDPDNELEDDFMNLANAECSDEEDDYYDDDEEDGRSDVSSNFEDEAMDEVGSLDGGQFTFKDEETKSRFTDYSMSSSDIKRNDQLTLLDERFEQMFAKYDDTEIGPLDCDEIAGYVPENSDLLLQYAAEFERDQQRSKLDKEVIKNCVINQEQDSDDSNDEFDKVEVKPKEKWDCESILSTYSNLYNHPKVISEPKSNKIKLNSRGIPVIESNRLTARALKNLDDSTSGRNAGAKSVGAQSVLSTLSTLSIRPKGETPEERNIRKKELKDYRKERRIEKKANAEAFKEEAKRQVKININNRMNIQGNRIL
ncbi:protein LTV1 homolog [Atheta coriaria]|uniref:protein LTV1 homolog n=1 Tax=Dalotia coriaria TaxID=877792 RepID=UPI0031F3CAB2